MSLFVPPLYHSQLSSLEHAPMLSTHSSSNVQLHDKPSRRGPTSCAHKEQTGSCSLIDICLSLHAARPASRCSLSALTPATLTACFLLSVHLLCVLHDTGGFLISAQGDLRHHPVCEQRSRPPPCCLSNFFVTAAFLLLHFRPRNYIISFKQMLKS